ncbi:MAG: FUSC family protein, partial [Gammaproteobacteria bacterium]|nr:FUSC family protein [Gammaproteobacteria bacterium]
DRLPGGPGFVIMAGSFVVVMAPMPQVSVWKLSVPLAVGILVAAVMYFGVMPHLSSFFGLGLLIFAVTFVFSYLFADPRKAVGKALGLAMFAVITSISNHQSYSFLATANITLMFPLCFLLLSFTAYFPFSPRPERAFLRLLGRFFHGYEHLLSAMHCDPEHPLTRFDRWRMACHARDVSTLPRKIGAWARFINVKELPGTTPEQLQALQAGLQQLAGRMNELLQEQRTPQAPILLQELREDVRAWRLGAGQSLHALRAGNTPREQDVLRSGLIDIMRRLEARIAETLNKSPEGQLNAHDGENFYRLLGVYRGVSESIVAYAATDGVIDWAPWREGRF